MSTARIASIHLQSVDVSWRTTWDFVTVETTDGLTGIGEWSDAASHVLAYPAARQLADELGGLVLDAALETVQRRIALLGPVPGGRRRLMATVLGGFDAALCDIAAQIKGVSLAAWFGGPADPQPALLYANINRAIHRRTPDEFAAQARAAVAAGFSAVKCAPFDFLIGAHRIQHGLDLARAVRDAIGDDVGLLLDLHGHVQVDEILAVADQLRALRPRWIEDVAEIDDVDGLRAVREATEAPIAAGEFVAHESEIAPALEAGLLDYFMPDVKHAGGPQRALDLARVAADAGAQVSPHNPCGPVATGFSAAIAAAAPMPFVEFAWGEWPDRPRILDPAEPVADGVFTASSGPGLGHRLVLPGN